MLQKTNKNIQRSNKGQILAIIMRVNLDESHIQFLNVFYNLLNFFFFYWSSLLWYSRNGSFLIQKYSRRQKGKGAHLSPFYSSHRSSLKELSWLCHPISFLSLSVMLSLIEVKYQSSVPEMTTNTLIKLWSHRAVLKA